jgi:hypothetical protein
MKSVTVTQDIDQSASSLWLTLRDFGAVARWNPNLKDSHLLAGSPACGVGATRHCDLADGRNYIRERIVTWEEGRSYTVDIYDGTMPLKSALATLTVEPLGPSRARAAMRLEYLPKFGALGWLLDVVMLRRMLRRQCEQVLQGLAARPDVPTAAPVTVRGAPDGGR